METPKCSRCKDVIKKKTAAGNHRNSGMKYCGTECSAKTLKKVTDTRLEKACSRCREVKSVLEFGLRHSNGRMVPDSYCRPCKSAKAMELKKKNRNINKEE